MNSRLIVTAFLVGSAFLLLQGCTAGADDAQDSETAGQDALSSSATRLVGAFHGAGGSVRPPTFQGIVFKSNGQFFADVDTGIRCITAPCPSNVRLTGTFTATQTSLTLRPVTPTAPET